MGEAIRRRFERLGELGAEEQLTHAYCVGDHRGGCAAQRLSTPIEFSREVPDEKSLVGRVSVISRRVDRGSYFSAVGRDAVAARLVG